MKNIEKCFEKSQILGDDEDDRKSPKNVRPKNILKFYLKALIV